MLERILWPWQGGGCGLVSVWGSVLLCDGRCLFWRHCWGLVLSREDGSLLSVPAGSCSATGKGMELPGHECYGKGICCALRLSFPARSIIRRKAWCHGTRIFLVPGPAVPGRAAGACRLDAPGSSCSFFCSAGQLPPVHAQRSQGVPGERTDEGVQV